MSKDATDEAIREMAKATGRKAGFLPLSDAHETDEAFERVVKAISAGIVAERERAADPAKLLFSNAFPVMINAIGDKEIGAAHEKEAWLGAGKDGDCGTLLDLGETKVFVPTDAEVCRKVAASIVAG